jgi:hypothetical protein
MRCAVLPGREKWSMTIELSADLRRISNWFNAYFERLLISGKD